MGAASLMQQQPILPGFNSCVLATAKRRLQAQWRSSCSLLRRHCLLGYSALFESALPISFLQAIDPTKRQRCFGHLPLFYAWMAQILEANASCSKALALIQNWYRSHHLPVPSSDTSSYCKARQRLCLEFLKAVHHRLVHHLAQRSSSLDCWHHFTLKALDGSSVQLLDTPANQDTYAQPSSQKAGCGFPSMGIAGLVNLTHGGWEQLATCAWSTHDSKAAVSLLEHVHSDDLLLADRAFCTYELIAGCLARGAQVVMRLHQARARALDWRKGKRLGQDERLVIWKRPTQPAGSTLSQSQWQALASTLTLRLIKSSVRNREGKRSDLIVVTTLLSPHHYPAAEVASLYARRWQIELKLRDLKTTLGMELFAVKSPAMAHKTLWMSIIAYNLVRALMQQAAMQGEMSQERLSFKAVLDFVVASQGGFQHCIGHPRLQQRAMQRWLQLCAAKKLNQRPRRKEPRALKRRPKNYQLLSAPRSVFTEIYHRNSYRKTA